MLIGMELRYELFGIDGRVQLVERDPVHLVHKRSPRSGDVPLFDPVLDQLAAA